MTDFNFVRATGFESPTTGSGAELGFDGVHGVLQAISHPSDTFIPFIYVASDHQWRVNGVVAMDMNAGGNVGLGTVATDAARIDVRPNQTVVGSRVFAISSDQNARVNSTPGPIELTWGASSGSAWDATVIGTDANVFTFTTYARQTSYDFVPMQITAHLDAGTNAGIVGHRVQTYIDSVATTPRGGTGSEVLMHTSAGGDVWALNPGVSNDTVPCGVMHGAEFDIDNAAGARGIHGIAITTSGIGTVSGTFAMTGHMSEMHPINDGFVLVPSGSQFEYAINTAAQNGNGGPVSATGSLWLSGGYSASIGLEWGWMGFNSGSWAVVPNGAYLSAKNAAGSANVPLIALGSGNQIAIGSGASVNPATGAYSQASDRRMKEDLHPLKNSTDIIGRLQVWDFAWKTGGRGYGVIAQDICEVIPQAVSRPAEEEAMWGVDYAKFVPILIAHAQELERRLAALEQR